MTDYKYLPASFYVPHAERAQKSVKEHGEKVESLSTLISKKINEASYEGLSSVTVTEIFDLGQEVVTEVLRYLESKKYRVDVYLAERDESPIAANMQNVMTIHW